MRRLVYESLLIEYETYEEAQEDLHKMDLLGWESVPQFNGYSIYESGSEDFPYAVEYRTIM